MRLFMRAACLRISAAAFVVIQLGFDCICPSHFSWAAEGPAIWKIDNDGGKGLVYLLGSIHMMKKGVVWYTPKISDSLAQATDVVLEVKLDTAGMEEMMKFMSQEGYYPRFDSLKGHIDAALFYETMYVAKQVGIAPDIMNRLKPWYAATVLSLFYIEAQGHDQDLGVEPFIEAIAKKRGLPLTGLESVEDQMQSLAGCEPEAQKALLRDTVKGRGRLGKKLDDLTYAWATGNMEKLTELLIEPMKKNPTVYETMVVKRNRDWIPKIKALMDTPGTHFVVVGVMHLVGPDGVIQIMHNNGIGVERY